MYCIYIKNCSYVTYRNDSIFFRYAKIRKKLVDDIQNLHYPCSGEYIRIICDYIYQDKYDIYAVLGVIRRYDILHAYMGLTINLKETSFDEPKGLLSKYQVFKNRCQMLFTPLQTDC